MPPPTSSSSSTSIPLRPRSDRMKDEIIKESSAGWQGSTTPLRIVKREGTPTPLTSNRVSHLIPRRSSGSYKAAARNNLVSSSPFKSGKPMGLAPAGSGQKRSLFGVGGANVNANTQKSGPTLRKASGEKRPRPDSLIQQAEHENALRVNEIGTRRRQSKSFLGLKEKEPVSKSPFLLGKDSDSDQIGQEDEIGRIDGGDERLNMPIAIEFPTRPDDDSTSPETTETDSSVNSREHKYAVDPQPPLPEPPLPYPVRPPEHRSTPSPSFERRSPGSSALQGSPARSSLVQKPRLLGPRSRSLSTMASGSPIEIPVRQRRKTVTFDERCDVVEFDRESHEDAVFDTDDDDAYGAPEPHNNQDSSLDSINFSAEDELHQAQMAFSAQPMVTLNDPEKFEQSLTGLVDSMMEEVTGLNEPSTPETHSGSFSRIAEDPDLSIGGAEGGIPLGRSHHVDRMREHQYDFPDNGPIPPPNFSPRRDFEDDQSSFPNFSNSTPQHHSHASPRTPSNHGTPMNTSYGSYGKVPVPSLPPDTECAEDGMPLGRTHHADRVRAARESGGDLDVKMLPPSPSPAKPIQRRCSDPNNAQDLVPRFDLGELQASSPRAGRGRELPDDDVFGSHDVQRDLLEELEFENPDIDADLLSNTSIASFHEFPPDATSSFYGQTDDESEDQSHSRRTMDISFGVRSDKSLDAIVTELHMPESQNVLPGNLIGDTGVKDTTNSEPVSRVTSPMVVDRSLPASPTPRSEAEQRMDISLNFNTNDTRDWDMDLDNNERDESVQHDVPQSPSFKSTQRPISAMIDFSQPGVDIAEMDMRSALDRLVDDVSIAGGVEPPTSANVSTRDRSGVSVSDGDLSMAESEMITEESMELLASLRESVRGAPQLPELSIPENLPLSRAASGIAHVASTPGAGPVPVLVLNTELSPPPPPVPPKSPATPTTPGKSARESRDEMIREKRREARARESGEYFVPPRRDAAGNLLDESPDRRRRSSGRPKPRRSLSTGVAEDLMDDGPAAKRRISTLRNQRGGVLGMPLENDDDLFSNSVERELKELAKKGNPSKKKTYELLEHDTVYASSSQDESLGTPNLPEEVANKAWRTFRRTSDMNKGEYAQELADLRAKEKGKSTGRVFVKVVRVKGLSVPVPQNQTVFTCTLFNGIHNVTTPEMKLDYNARIDQEFELIEHAKLEFTISLKVRKDPHIQQQYKTLQAPTIPTSSPALSVPHKTRLFGNIFGSSPKKPKTPISHQRAQTDPLVPFVMQENLARYLTQDGVLGRTFVKFKDIAPYCDTKLMETSFTFFGQRLSAPGEGGGAGGTSVPKPIGELVLQVFRLPPLPGIPTDRIPMSLDECLKGLHQAKWHRQTYFEGTLTQLGGDCSTWRRRSLRLVGATLIAFNDVTKRAMAKIDLKKAIAIQDDQDPEHASKQRDVDDFDAMYGVERSFRLIFPANEEITFFADTDEEKAKWLEMFRAIIGRFPPLPLWAELVLQRQEQAAPPPPISTNSK